MRLSAVAALIMACLFLGDSALAQDLTSACHAASPTRQVIVSTNAGPTIRGTLLCIADEEVLIARGGMVTRTPLADVRRIQTPADPVWDGGVKGAAIPLIMAALFCRDHCRPEPFLRAALAYGLIGLTWDSLDANQKTIYDGRRPAATVTWRVRF